ncbi:MAG: bifunctional oligoribonuclease/PAP phosphatase NrnA [Anaerolineae bacterium]|nr:bifunctional oligoribonuclease/PAP phosphatase NrnA [Anaerolineae bacterium]
MRTSEAMMNPIVLNKAVHLLKQSKRPLIISHPRPDGDTIGSTLALRLALVYLGKSPVVACVHPIPEMLSYLPGVKTFVSSIPEDIDPVTPATQHTSGVDLVVAVDMSDLERTGGIYQETRHGQLSLLVIDHHETNDEFGDVNLVDPTAAATALLMAELIEALGITIDTDIATCLLTGIITDTRGLRTTNTTPAVLSFVARMIEAGGDYLSVVQKTLDSVTYWQMRAWGIALNRLQLHNGVAWTTLPIAEKQQLGIEDHADLGFSNFLSRIAEANISVSFLEMNDGTVKVSMRARPGYNVAWIAKELGGGGHRQAAGCSIPGPLSVASERVLPYVFQEAQEKS